mmetsp:Transcript_34961/g.87217  ORF Transcript_34961/g.87217 Transcript_34961/m.87217 type:complete len:108 (-) Transcript_34961:323-646(-)
MKYYLGRVNSSGHGMPNNRAKEARLYHQAADQGHAAAQNAIGTYYNHGIAVEQDKREAARYYRLAAEQGDVLSQLYSGELFLEEAAAGRALLAEPGEAGQLLAQATQ